LVVLLVANFLLLGCAATLEANPLHYLPAGNLGPIKLLKSPPAPGSAEQAADLRETIAIHKRMTRSEEVIAKSQKKISVFSFKPAIGDCFEPGKLPKTKAFLKRVESDTDAIADNAQKFWKRPHPYAVEPKLAKKNDTINENNFSYPSGHSTESTVLASLLSELFPEKQKQILGLGHDLGWYRVQLGKHYPTDYEAGRELGAAIVRELKASPKFQRDFAEVKKEIAPTRHTTTTADKP
jgi:acid phosphatase (class A)